VRLNQLQFDNTTDVVYALTMNLGGRVRVGEEMKVLISANLSNSGHTSPMVSKSVFYPSEVSFTSSSVSSVRLAFLHNKISMDTGWYRLNVRVGGAYQVYFPTGSDFVVRALSEPVLGPLMKGVSFSSDGSKILIDFVSSTNQGGSLKYERDCSTFFQVYISGSEVLLSGKGSESRCVWIDTRRMEMSLSGSSPLLNIGDVIKLKDGVVKAACVAKDTNMCESWPFTVPHNATLSGPVGIGLSVGPVVKLSIPNVLGPCDGLDLDLSSSSGSGGREWKSFRIQVSLIPVNTNSSLSLEKYFKNRTQSSSSLKSLLSVPIHVSHELLSVGSVHTFEVELCSFLSLCGRTVKSFEVSASENIPIVSLRPSTLITMSRNSSLLISGSSFVSSCGVSHKSSSSLTYVWGVYENDELLDSADVKSVSVNPLQFKLPSYRLQAGSLYVIKLTVTHRTSARSTSNSVQVSVRSGELVCMFSSPSSASSSSLTPLSYSQLSLRMTESLSLDWSKSYDENDYVPGSTLSGGGWANRLNFSWSCFRVTPTYLASCDEFLMLSQTSPSRVTIKLNSTSSIALGDMFQVSFRGRSVSYGDNRECEKAFDIVIVDVLTPIVSLSVVGGLSSTTSLGTVIKINPSSKLKLIGTVQTKSRGLAIWTVDNPAIALSSSLSPTSVSVVSLSTSQTINFILPTTALQIQDPLSFVLTLSCVLENGRSMSSSLTIATNSPPGQCALNIFPDSGKMLDTKFFMSSSGVDDDLPLSYQFGYSSISAANDVAREMVVLRSKLELSFALTTLPSGSAESNYSLECLSRVFDALDSSSFASFDVLVRPVPLSLNELKGYVSGGVNESLTNLDVDSLKTVISSSATVLNLVNCSLAPVSVCEALNRKRCGSVSGTCGECVSGSVGVEGPSNTPCLFVATRRSLTYTHQRLLASCSSNIDCQDSLFLECNSQSNLCEPIQQSCPNSCSGHGSCVWVSKYDQSVSVPACGVLDVDCVPRCECDEEYAGSSSCSFRDDEVLEMMEIRELLLENVAEFMSLENVDASTVKSWMMTLSLIGSDSLGLSLDSKRAMASLSVKILRLSREIGLSMEDLIGSGLVKVLDLCVSGLSNSDDLPLLVSLLREYNKFVTSDMLEAQDVLSSISPYLRSSSFILSSLSSLILAIPDTNLEALVKGQSSSPSQQSIELSPELLFPLRISISETLVQSTKESPSVIPRNGSLANESVTESQLSLPLYLSIGSPPCSGNSTSGMGCSFRAMLQHKLKPSSSIVSMTNSLPSSSAFTYFETTCPARLVENRSFVCPSGEILTISCNGSSSPLRGRRYCPVRSNSIECQAKVHSSSRSGLSCQLSNHNESMSVCVCNLTEIGVIGDAGAVTFSLMSIERSVMSDFVSTWETVPSLSSGDVSSSWVVLVTVGGLGGVFLVFFFLGIQLDWNEERALSLSLEKRNTRARWWFVGISPEDPPSDHHSASEESPMMQLVEESLPSVFQCTSLWTKFKQEMKVYHRWLGIVLYYSPDFPRSMRLLSLFSSIVIMLFVQSVTYNIADPDDGSCEACEDEIHCLSLSSTLNVRESRCYWQTSSTQTDSDGSVPGLGTCHFREIGGDMTRMFIVAMISAIVSAPFALSVQYLIATVLSRKTFDEEETEKDNQVFQEKRTQSRRSVAISTDLVECCGSSSLEDYNNLQNELSEYYKHLVTKREKVAAEEFRVCWGSLVESQTNSKTSRLTEVVLNRPKGETLHKNTVKDLAQEISSVRREVCREYKWMQVLGSKLGHDRRRANGGLKNEVSVMLTKRRRLLFLFVQDLSSGVSGEMLSMKSQRDSSVMSSKTKIRLEGVSTKAKVAGWLFIGLMDIGMLFYVYLFAMQQTHTRQSAWFQSFLMWLVFDMIAATGGVMLSHLLIPLYVLADVSKIKEKVLSDLLTFHEKYLKNGLPQDEEEGAGRSIKTTDDDKLFNAAKYLFVSWRVASLCRELPESQLILQFNTLWPKKKFGEKEAEVASEYDQDVLFNAVSQIVVFFLTSLLRCHTLLQDMILQTVCNSGLGLIIVWLIQLYAIHPALPVMLVLVLVLLVGYLLRIASGKNNAFAARLASVIPTQEPSQESSSLPPSTQNLLPLDTVPIATPAVHEEAIVVSQMNERQLMMSRHLGDSGEEGSDDSAEVEKKLFLLFQKISAQIDESRESESGDDELRKYEISSNSNSNDSEGNESEESGGIKWRMHSPLSYSSDGQIGDQGSDPFCANFNFSDDSDEGKQA
jgi:hypothetical protein